MAFELPSDCPSILTANPSQTLYLAATKHAFSLHFHLRHVFCFYEMTPQTLQTTLSLTDENILRVDELLIENLDGCTREVEYSSCWLQPALALASAQFGFSPCFRGGLLLASVPALRDIVQTLDLSQNELLAIRI